MLMLLCIIYMKKNLLLKVAPFLTIISLSSCSEKNDRPETSTAFVKESIETFDTRIEEYLQNGKKIKNIASISDILTHLEHLKNTGEIADFCLTHDSASSTLKSVQILVKNLDDSFFFYFTQYDSQQRGSSVEVSHKGFLLKEDSKNVEVFRSIMEESTSSNLTNSNAKIFSNSNWTIKQNQVRAIYPYYISSSFETDSAKIIPLGKKIESTLDLYDEHTLKSVNLMIDCIGVE